MAAAHRAVDADGDTVERERGNRFNLIQWRSCRPALSCSEAKVCGRGTSSFIRHDAPKLLDPAELRMSGCGARRQAHVHAVVGGTLMLLLLLMQGGMCALTTTQLEAIKSEHCSNGTLSLTRVCNATWRPYPTGCPSDEEQYSCRSPARGSRCSVISQYNVTCLTPIRCRELQLPNNSALAVLNPTVLQTMKIK